MPNNFSALTCENLRHLRMPNIELCSGATDATWRPCHPPERGCVEDQPQQPGKEGASPCLSSLEANWVLRLAFSTAALRCVCQFRPAPWPRKILFPFCAGFVFNLRRFNYAETH
jgi:hypothetical protein